MGEIFPDGLNLGLAEAGRRYGWLSRIGVADINGFDYGRTVTPVPRLRGPEWLQKFEFRVLLKLHPELRRRNRSARIALQSKIWREVRYRYLDVPVSYLGFSTTTSGNTAAG